MTKLPDEMVAAWLNRQDGVLTRGGGEPTWNRLAEALKRVGQIGMAKDIRMRKCGDSSTEGRQQSMEVDSSKGDYYYNYA